MAEKKSSAWILAEEIQRWISKQDYCGEPLLHASVCCDLVGRLRFISAIEKIIINSGSILKSYGRKTKIDELLEALE